MPAEPTERTRPSRRRVALVVGPLIGLIVAANVGDALAPTLVDQHPLLLITLNARNRNLALTTNLLDPIPYYVVGMVRLLASDPLFFLLGRWYGDGAIEWVARRSPTYGKWLQRAEGWFGRAAYPLIVVAPNNIICLFAGSAGMRPSVFFALNISGTIARLYLIRLFGDIFSGPIDSVLDFIAEYRLPLLAVSIGLTVFAVWNERRKAGETELGSLMHIDEEIDEIEREHESSDDDR